MSTYIWVIELGQFAVLCSRLSQARPSLQLEQAVFRLEMGWDFQSSRHPVLFVQKGWVCQEHFQKKVRRIKVALY